MQQIGYTEVLSKNSTLYCHKSLFSLAKAKTVWRSAVLISLKIHDRVSAEIFIFYIFLFSFKSFLFLVIWKIRIPQKFWGMNAFLKFFAVYESQFVSA